MGLDEAAPELEKDLRLRGDSQGPSTALIDHNCWVPAVRKRMLLSFGAIRKCQEET
jgi:hypothetical protein